MSLRLERNGVYFAFLTVCLSLGAAAGVLLAFGYIWALEQSLDAAVRLVEIYR